MTEIYSDLAELDDWLGTLQDLQTGLQSGLISASNHNYSPSSLTSTKHHDLPLPDLYAWEQSNTDGGNCIKTSSELQQVNGVCRPDLLAPIMRDKGSLSSHYAAQSIRASFNTSSCKEATAENDLNCLLQELTVVEQKMKELDQSEGDYTRRYSLASSSAFEYRIQPCPTSSDSGINEAATPSETRLPRPTSDILSDHHHLSTISDLTPTRGAHGDPPTPDMLRMMSSTSCGGAPRPRIASTGAVSLSRLDMDREFGQSICSSPSRGSTSTEDCCDFDRSLDDYAEISQKINEAMEKVEKMNLKKIVVRVFRTDKTTKAVLIDDQMRVGQVVDLLIEKNFLTPSTKLALVEKVPNLKMERCLEDHEILSNCILSWPENSKNMIFFEEKDDLYGVFENPKEWIGSEYEDSFGQLHESAIKEIFRQSETAVPDFKDYIYIKKPGEKTWTRKYCVVRNSGLYASKKKKSTSPADLVRIMVFDTQFHLYTTTGGWTKLKAPTPYGFALKPYSAQDRHSKCVLYFCASDEHALRKWCSLLRIAQYGRQLLHNYHCRQHRLNRTPCPPDHSQPVVSSPSMPEHLCRHPPSPPALPPPFERKLSLPGGSTPTINSPNHRFYASASAARGLHQMTAPRFIYEDDHLMSSSSSSTSRHQQHLIGHSWGDQIV